MTFKEVLANPEGKKIVESIEHIGDKYKTDDKLKKVRESNIKDLKDDFGYEYEGEGKKTTEKDDKLDYNAIVNEMIKDTSEGFSVADIHNAAKKIGIDASHIKFGSDEAKKLIKLAGEKAGVDVHTGEKKETSKKDDDTPYQYETVEDMVSFFIDQLQDDENINKKVMKDVYNLALGLMKEDKIDATKFKKLYKENENVIYNKIKEIYSKSEDDELQKSFTELGVK